MIGHRSGNVADENAGALASTSELIERRRIDRLRQRVPNGGGRIADFFELTLFNQRDLRVARQAQIKLSAAIEKCDRFRA
jgi:hypothetical protein